jgi:hypothetical protein
VALASDAPLGALSVIFARREMRGAGGRPGQLVLVAVTEGALGRGRLPAGAGTAEPAAAPRRGRRLDGAASCRPAAAGAPEPQPLAVGWLEVSRILSRATDRLHAISVLAVRTVRDVGTQRSLSSWFAMVATGHSYRSPTKLAALLEP